MQIRRARSDDLKQIVALLADDVLGSRRESVGEPLADSYTRAFAEIDADANNELLIGEEEGEIVATLQLTFIPYLVQQGSKRALIEGVRVASRRRGHGLGEELFRWAIDRARAHGCRMIQLTTDKQRPEAKRFYERLGFVASHEGMKLRLE